MRQGQFTSVAHRRHPRKRQAPTWRGWARRGEIKAGALRYVTGDGGYLIQDPDVDAMTPSCWGRLDSGWWVYPEPWLGPVSAL